MWRWRESNPRPQRKFKKRLARDRTCFRCADMSHAQGISVRRHVDYALQRCAAILHRTTRIVVIYRRTGVNDRGHFRKQMRRRERNSQRSSSHHHLQKYLFQVLQLVCLNILVSYFSNRFALAICKNIDLHVESGTSPI